MRNEWWMHWWQGYVAIKVRGRTIERFINRMMVKRLAAWNMTRLSEEEVQVYISIQDFKQLRSLLKETSCRLIITQKRGFPFILQRAKKKNGFILGGIAFCILLYFLSAMIWDIEIEGVQNPENEPLLMEQLEEMGVKRWGFKFQAEDPLLIKQKITEEIPDMTWAGFEFKGTTAHLKVVEKTLPDLPETTGPRHLVATKKAVIHDIFVESGQAVVKPNQYVEPGDLLVSGEIGTEDEPQIVSARGNVWGEVWYESHIEVPLKQNRSILTGEQKNRYHVHLGPISFPIWGSGHVGFTDFIRDEQPLILRLGKWQSPIYLMKERFLASEVVEQEFREDEAKELGLRWGRERLAEQMASDAEIKEENVLKKEIEHGKVYMKVHYTVIEEISTEETIIQGD